MKLYEVEMITTTTRTIAVHANSEDDAIERAKEIPYSNMNWDIREEIEDIFVEETYEEQD